MTRAALSTDPVVSSGAFPPGAGLPGALARAIAAGLIAAVPMVRPAPADTTLPTGARVLRGDVTVSGAGAELTVVQRSDRAIVNWNSFSIGSEAQVNFAQRDSDASILNRVTGAAGTTLAGRLAATGQVYLINPNGIAITPTGTVRVGGGFVASTLDVSDDDFMRGDLDFTGTGHSAGVRNAGAITTGRGGYVALLGGTVANVGLIAAPLGRVGLGSGERMTLDLSGDGFLQVALPTGAGAEGDGALIEHSGEISAEGGTVMIRAATAQAAARNAINLSGVVQARTVSGRNGAITLGGGPGGAVRVSGRVDASAPEAGARGGTVEVTGDRVTLAGARIDASGASGGGDVRIGGDWQGAEGTPRASTAAVDADTVIAADATGSGRGGTVVVWSDGRTDFSGRISATGAGEGAGGEAEVSGKAQLSYLGWTDLSSESGTFGTLLLDPYNLTITADPGAGVSLTATGDDSTLAVSALETALSWANVTISTGSGGGQNGDITVAAPVIWTGDTVLTLEAAGDIFINADMNGPGALAGLVLSAGGDYAIAPGHKVTLSGNYATLEIGGQAYTLIQRMADLEAISDDLGGFYALDQDLWVYGSPYTTSVTAASPFTGTFAGLGHSIFDFEISGSGSGNFGLFGQNAGTIRDVRLIDHNVTVAGSSQVNVGALVGYNTGLIRNAYASGTLTVSGDAGAEVNAGGLVGYNFGGSITNADAGGSVTVTGPLATVYAGGLIGYASGGVISGSHATSAVTASTSLATASHAHAGGLVGLSDSGTTLSDSYASGDVSASGPGDTVYAGGLVGSNESGVILRSSASGAAEVSGTADLLAAGGLVGNGEGGSLTDTYATGDATAVTGVAGGAYAGGLIGRFASSADLANAYATGVVTASGIAGAEVFAGGLVGTLLDSTITSGFFDRQTTGIDEEAGVGDTLGHAGVIGLDTDAMTSALTFIDAGWDFTTIWGKSVAGENDGYMVLAAQSDPAGWYDAYVRLPTEDITMAYGDPGPPVDLSLAWPDGDPLTVSWGWGVDAGTLDAGIYENYAWAGVPTITSGDDSADIYMDGVGSGRLIVAPRALTVTGVDQSRIYGAANPVMSYAITSGALVDGDALDLDFGTAAGATASVGTYDITVTRPSDDTNYAITYDPGQLTVTPRALTVTATDLSRIYGASNPALGYVVTSGALVNGDRLGGTLATQADRDAPVGSYAITQGTLTGGANYQLGFVPGTLTVMPRPEGETVRPVGTMPPRPVGITPRLVSRGVFNARRYGPFGSSGEGSIEDFRLGSAPCLTATHAPLGCVASWSE